MFATPSHIIRRNIQISRAKLASIYKGQQKQKLLSKSLQNVYFSWNNWVPWAQEGPHTLLKPQSFFFRNYITKLKKYRSMKKFQVNLLLIYTIIWLNFISQMHTIARTLLTYTKILSSIAHLGKKIDFTSNMNTTSSLLVWPLINAETLFRKKRRESFLFAYGDCKKCFKIIVSGNLIIIFNELDG